MEGWRSFIACVSCLQRVGAMSIVATIVAPRDGGTVMKSRCGLQLQ